MTEAPEALWVAKALFKAFPVHLTLVLLNPDISCLAKSFDPDQLDSKEAIWSGSTLFAIKYVYLYEQSGSSNLIGWKLEVGVTS